MFLNLGVVGTRHQIQIFTRTSLRLALQKSLLSNRPFFSQFCSSWFEDGRSVNISGPHRWLRCSPLIPSFSEDELCGNGIDFDGVAGWALQLFLCRYLIASKERPSQHLCFVLNVLGFVSIYFVRTETYKQRYNRRACRTMALLFDSSQVAGVFRIRIISGRIYLPRFPNYLRHLLAELLAGFGVSFSFFFLE